MTVAIERVATLDRALLSACDFSFGTPARAYPFDPGFETPRAVRMIAVARVDGLVAGYGVCQRSGDAAEIRRLEIDAAHRGQGLACRLLDVARGWAAELGLAALRLETLADNPDAARFFAQQGFAAAGQEGVVLHWYLPLPR